VKASVGSLLSWAPFCVAAAVSDVAVASKLFSYLDKSSKVETFKRKMFASRRQNQMPKDNE
jgi:hypothetical protein